MTALSALVALTLLGHVAGQTTPPHTFNWGFATISGLVLNQCSNVVIQALSLTGTGPPPSTAPYTLRAYSPNVITTQVQIGSDPTNLNWTVTAPTGSVLVSVVDTNNQQGGVVLLTVNPGSGGCSVEATTASNFKVTTNTTTARTCDPVGLTISGGSKPYSITIVTVGPNESIARLGNDDDFYTWINRASPNQQVLVSAQDSNGAFAVATGFISTQGSTDVTCGGIQSFSGNSANPGASQPSGTNTSGGAGSTSTSVPTPPSSNIAVIAGAVAGGITLILAVVLVFVCLRKRKKSSERVDVDLDGAVSRGKTVRETTHYSSVPANMSTPNVVPDSRFDHYMHTGPQRQPYDPFLSQQRMSGVESHHGEKGPLHDRRSYNPHARPVSQITSTDSYYSHSVGGANSFGVNSRRDNLPHHPLSPTASLSVYSDSQPGTHTSGSRTVSSVPDSRSNFVGGGIPGQEDANTMNPPRSRFVVANSNRDDLLPAVSADQKAKMRTVEEEGPQRPIVKHTDAGAAPIELPPAYGEQQIGVGASMSASGSGAAPAPPAPGPSRRSPSPVKGIRW